MLTNVRQENPSKGISIIAVAQLMRPNNLISFLAILLKEHHVPPGRRAEMACVVIRISRPGEPVIGHMIPLFAGDFTCLAADAHARIGEEANLDVIFDKGMPALIATLNSFADHRLSILPRMP